MSAGHSITVQGVGWIGPAGFGCVRSGYGRDAGTAGIDDQAIKVLFAHPVKNYGRFDHATRLTCAAIALALRDAGVAYAPFQKLDIGVVGTAPGGSLRADVDYFRDYLDGGRTLSRGNLFIYTLPSSPPGEAAIHFGLQGPLVYVADPGASLTAALDTAEEMLESNETASVLAGRVDRDAAVYLLLTYGDATAGALCGLEAAKAAVQGQDGLAEQVKRLTDLRSQERRT